MSDESNSIRFRTGANDNLLSILGDLVSSDGARTFRVPMGTPGQFLAVDLTAECGLSWLTPSGNLTTFSDGVTKALNNVTNDLVTGTPVAQVNAIANAGDIDLTTSGATDINLTSGLAIVATAAGLINLTAGGSFGITATDAIQLNALGAGGFGITLLTGGTGDILVSSSDRVDIDANALLELTGSGIRIVSNPASVLILGSGANTLIAAGSALTATAGGNTSFTANAASNGGFSINTDGTGDVSFNASHDETHTVGRNFALTAAGSGGVSIDSTNGNLTLDAGSGDGTAEVRIMPTVSAPAATRTFRIWNGAGDGQGTVLTPTTGTVVDTEVRAALDSLLQQMHEWGWLTNPNP